MTSFSLRVASLISALAVAVIGFGCASPNVNPRAAKTNAGYVDIYTPDAQDLAYYVAHAQGTNQFKRMFAELDPVPSGILRLSFAPGTHSLRITIMNRVISMPATIQVEVENGKITPVHLTLTKGGTTSVQTQEQVGSRYGRRVKYGSYESEMYNLTAANEPPVAYQVKAQMPYAQATK
jgi:hypothetical protein